MKQRKKNFPQLSVELLEAILQNAADGITVQDLTGKVIYANKAAAAVSGYTSVKDFLDSSSQDLPKFEIQNAVGKPYPLDELPGRKVIRGEPFAEATVKFHSLQNRQEKWARIKATPIYQKDHHTVQFVINVLQDITVEKKREKNREMFFAIASHELKSLLTSIKAYTQLLQKRFIHKLDKTSYSFLFRLDSQIDKLTLLIVDLLDLSRIKAGKLQLTKEFFDINLLVQDIVTDMQLTTKQKLLIQGKVKQKIFADKGRVTQVIINFLSNAIKYAPSAKKIIIRLHQEEEHCLVKVIDFGKGIHPKDQKQIFKLFYQSKQKKHSQEEGLGIGLFLAKAIIKQHKGTIGVESNPPKGSSFFFRLPLQIK